MTSTWFKPQIAVVNCASHIPSLLNGPRATPIQLKRLMLSPSIPVKSTLIEGYDFIGEWASQCNSNWLIGKFQTQPYQSCSKTALTAAGVAYAMNF